MRIHILQHVDFENPGSIVDWTQEKQFPVAYTRFYLGESLPLLDDFELSRNYLNRILRYLEKQ